MNPILYNPPIIYLTKGGFLAQHLKRMLKSKMRITKRLLLLLILTFSFTLSSFSQTTPIYQKSFSFTATGQQPSASGEAVEGRGINYLKVSWESKGITAPTACSLNLEGNSNLSLSWTVLATFDCTSNSVSGFYKNSYIYFRLNLTSYTAASAGDLQTTVIGQSANTVALVQVTPDINYPTPYGLAVVLVSATSGTVVTTSTVLIGTIDCVNATGTAATLTLTNTAGTNLVPLTVSIPANGGLILNYFAGKLAVGIKWSAGTISALYCSINGWM